MYSKIKLGLISYLISFQALACPQPVTPLKKGEQAPCTGFLFSPEKELELRIRNEEYKLLLEQSNLYLQQKELFVKELATTEKIAEKEREKAEIWRKLAEESSLKYIESEEDRGFRDWLFLIAGVGLTVAAGYAVGAASK